ncbi:keratin, type I cytoskeletal 10-like [Penaeus japonicus]|uniref:keratin, type I cytoskeletal 10-like n=1 Tax=Penaeus japonicus TaxID=27405 RepID=UPI001C714EA1|nr:keratin, type I cytoskeletal 10-like [Penaeus japonicus]
MIRALFTVMVLALVVAFAAAGHFGGGGFSGGHFGGFGGGKFGGFGGGGFGGGFGGGHRGFGGGFGGFRGGHGGFGGGFGGKLLYFVSHFLLSFFLTFLLYSK